MEAELVTNLQNAYPDVQDRVEDREFTLEDMLESQSKSIDEREVFDHVRDIRDPEHPLTLEQLGVVLLENIQVNDEKSSCLVEFQPTIPHCSMATLIGLAIKVQLMRVLPQRFKIEVRILPGTHVQEAAVNKQLSDKERVAAALENSYLLDVINDCLLLSEEQEVPVYLKPHLNGEILSNNPKLRYMLRSRQPAKSYRRWLQIKDEKMEKGTSILTKI